MAKDRTRLLLIRDAFLEARRLTHGNPVDFDLMRAVWLADLASELMLATMTADNGLTTNDKMGFYDYIAALKKADDPAITQLMNHEASLDNLHKRRNLVHHGDSLTHARARAAVGKAEAFLQQAFMDIFGVDLESMSLLTFLQPSEAKAELEKAQALIEGHNYNGAAFCIGIALDYTRDLMKAAAGNKRSLWQGPIFGSSSQMRLSHGTEPTGIVEEGLVSAVRDMALVLELTRYGVDSGAAMDFLASVQGVGGFRHKIPTTNRQFSEGMVKEQLAFLADVLYRLERHNP